jgi:hypothetical protein
MKLRDNYYQALIAELLFLIKGIIHRVVRASNCNVRVVSSDIEPG